ncbi:hypothetical protein KHQ89_06545 [Mycoplasmatota bacterium]|nr:hypothetical protein KHQ89_06545 [Mycoplasmatota bacterium]
MKWIKRTMIIISSFMIVVACLALIILPINEMPTPTGSYDIGTKSFVLTDYNREEAYSDDVMYRRIKIQSWYPSDDTQGYEQMPWLEEGRIIAQSLSSIYGFPSFMLNHLELIESHAYKNALISQQEDSYPVIVISHGWSGFRAIHSDLAEELASQGYIVIGIDHTFGSIATVFSEDDISYIYEDALPSTDTYESFLSYANQLIYTYASDISFTIDQLTLLNDSDFSNKLDLDKIGLLGHSTGAGAGVATAINDSRIKAIMGMDAWVEPVLETDIDKQLTTPSLFYRSQSWEESINNEHLLRLFDESLSDSYLYQIDETEHTDFSMSYMISPIMKYVGLSGKIDKDKLITILKTTSTSFFDYYLKDNQYEALDALNDKWEEVNWVES